jgi:hypothetical protein
MRFIEIPALITEDIEDPSIVDITEEISVSISGTTMTINGQDTDENSTKLIVSGEATITLTGDTTVNAFTLQNIRAPSLHKISVKTNNKGNFTYVPNNTVTASSVSTTTKTGSDFEILLITTNGGETYVDFDMADYTSPALYTSNALTGFDISELTSTYGATAKLYKPDGTLLTTVTSATTGNGVNFGYTESTPQDVTYTLEVEDDLGRTSRYDLPRKWISYAMETNSTPGFEKIALAGNEYTSTTIVPNLTSTSKVRVHKTGNHGYLGINFKIQGRNTTNGAWVDIDDTGENENDDESKEFLAFGDYLYHRVWVKPTAKATTTVSSSNVVTLTLSNLTEENVTTSFTGVDPFDLNESTNTYVFEETTKVGTIPFTVTLGTETYTNAVTATTEGTAYDYVTLAFANPTLSLTTSNVTISSAKLYRDDVLFHTYGTESNVVLRSDQTGTYQAVVNDVYYSNRVVPDFTTTRSVSAPQLEFDGYNRLNLSNITPTSTTLGVPDGTTRDLTTQSNVYIYETGTYTANVQTSETFAYLSNVVTSQPSQNPTDVGPTFTFDGYNRLAISNLTQTSSTLKYGSNTYDTNTASNVYVTDAGEYKLEASDANTFVMSNVYVGAVSQHPSDVVPTLTFDGYNKLTIDNDGNGDTGMKNVTISGGPWDNHTFKPDDNAQKGKFQWDLWLNTANYQIGNKHNLEYVPGYGWYVLNQDGTGFGDVTPTSATSGTYLDGNGVSQTFSTNLASSSGGVLSIAHTAGTMTVNESDFFEGGIFPPKVGSLESVTIKKDGVAFATTTSNTVYIRDTGTYTAEVKGSGAYAIELSNVVTGTVSQHPADVVPSLTYDNYNKITLENMNYEDTTTVSDPNGSIHEIGTAKTMYVKDTGEYVFKISGTDKYVESNVYVSSVDLAGAPTKPIDFDGYNKLTLIDAGSNVSANVTYFSNTYELGSANVLYINGAGTYDLEMSGSNVFALSSNVVGAISTGVIANPVFTSTTAITTDTNWTSGSGWEITADSTNNSTDRPGWKAFDNTWETSNEQNIWHSAETATSTSSPKWLKIKYPSAYKAIQYSIQIRDLSYPRYPKTWKFQGSNNDSDWTDLDTQTNKTDWAGNNTVMFTFSNSTAYQYYRVYITATDTSDSDGGCCIRELKVYTLATGSQVGNVPLPDYTYPNTITVDSALSGTSIIIANDSHQVSGGKWYTLNHSTYIGNRFIFWDNAIGYWSYFDTQGNRPDSSWDNPGGPPGRFFMETDGDLKLFHGSNGSTIMHIKPNSSSNPWPRISAPSLTFDGYNKLTLENFTTTESDTRTAKLTDPNGSTYALGQTQDAIYIKDQGDYFLEVTNSDQSAVVKTTVGTVTSPPTYQYIGFGGMTDLSGSYTTTNTYLLKLTKADGTPLLYTDIETFTILMDNGNGTNLDFTHIFEETKEPYAAAVGATTTTWHGDSQLEVTALADGTTLSDHATNTYIAFYFKLNEPTTIIDGAILTVHRNDKEQWKNAKAFGTNTDPSTFSSPHTPTDWTELVEVTTVDGPLGSYNGGSNPSEPWTSLGATQDFNASAPGLYIQPSLTFDNYSKLSINNLTPTSSRLTYGSNTYEIGTASNVYIEHGGTYKMATGDANTFALVSNVVGAIATGKFDPLDTTSDYSILGSAFTPSTTSDTQSTTSLSNDGTRVLVDNETGYFIQVYEYSSGSWTQLGSDINYGTSSTSSRISGDGNRVCVGISSSNQVKVYEYSSGSWSQIGTTITGSNGFGTDTSLNYDGTRLMVGASGDYNTRGNQTVWQESGGNWTQLGSTLYCNHNSYPHSLCGGNVDINNDGTVVCAGGYKGHSQDKGCLHVWKYNGSSWTQSFFSEGGNDHHSNYCRLSGDGKVVMYSHDRWNEPRGRVNFYENTSGASWSQIGGYLEDKKLGDLSNDGKTVVVGKSDASIDSQVYRFDGSAWVQLGSNLEHTSTTLSISSDGSTVAIGNSTSGANKVSVYKGTTPSPSLTYDTSNKLSIENLTPTSTTLTDPNGSSFDIGTASNVYIRDSGTYSIASKDANTFLLASNTVTGTPTGTTYVYDSNTFTTPSQTYDNTKTITVSNVPSTLTDVVGKIYKGSTAYTIHATTSSSNVIIENEGTYVSVFTTATQAFLTNAIDATQPTITSDDTTIEDAAPIVTTTTSTVQEQDPETFSYTGAIQTYTVPDDVTSIKVKCWGAAGGSLNGGAGGYAGGTVSVTPGETIQVVVGQGGPTGGDNLGSGGGFTGILSVWNTSDIAATHAGSIIIAGAGGGGGNSSNNPAGNGGGETGGVGQNDASGAKPGTQTAAGSAESDTSAATNPTGGSYFRGGNSAGNGFYAAIPWPAGVWGGNYQRSKASGGSQGGGGGGGYYGAGGAGNRNSVNSRGAAGGSGYIGGDGTHEVTNGENLATSLTQKSSLPPKTDDEHYVSGAGTPASTDTNGGDGLVVIIPTKEVTTTTTTTGGGLAGSTAVPDETTTDAPSVTLDATDTTVTDPTLDLDFTTTLPRTLKRYNGVTNSSIGARFNRHETNKKRIEKSINTDTFSMELTANNASSPTTLTVTVANSKFVINDDETPTLGFIRGETYTFDQSDASNSGHPLVLVTSEDGATQYTTGWTTTPSSDYIPGVSGAQGTFIVPYDVPDTIYYKCSNHNNMGGEINTTFGNAFSLGEFTVAANTHVSGEYTLATNYDGTTSNLYVNGSLITQTTPSPAISAGVKDFILGKEFDGYVKNFKFWNYAKGF